MAATNDASTLSSGSATGSLAAARAKVSRRASAAEASVAEATFTSMGDR